MMLRHPARTFWLIASGVFILDQVTKAIVRALWGVPSSALPLDGLVARFIAPAFGTYDSLPLFGEVFQLTHVRNTGAAFGLLSGYQPVFIATSLIVLLVVGAYWRRARPAAWPIVIALGLVSGGALGNLVDRAVIGRVTDFFDVAIIDFPVFNIADMAIVGGVGVLIAWLLFGPQESEAVSVPAEPAQAGPVVTLDPPHAEDSAR